MSKWFLIATCLAVLIEPSSADSQSPVITLDGTDPVSITQGDPYIDAGATALNDVDGDITDQIVIYNPVNPYISGTYSVSYFVIDVAGTYNVTNYAVATRTVDVVYRKKK